MGARGAGGGVPPGGRAARRAVAADAQRRDDARPVEDAAPGGDRRRLRDDRLLALQPALHGADPRGAAALAARPVEPARVPAARGVRPRGHALQLHLHRREPPHRAGAHGQHRRLEAGLVGDLLGLVPPEAARGGGAAARRRQLRARPGARGRRRRAREPRAGRAPLHRLDRGVPGDVAHDRREPRPLPRLPAHRGRDGRQGLRLRPPLGRRGRGSRSRSCRGAFEYQGQKCSAASRAYVPESLWPRLRERLLALVAEIQVGEVEDFRNFMGAVIDREAFDRIRALRRPRPRLREGEDPHRRAAATTRPASSSSRPWSRPWTPASSSWRRRSSGRCSPCLSTPTPGSTRRSTCARRPRPTASPAPSSPATAAPSPRRRGGSPTPPGTST